VTRSKKTCTCTVVQAPDLTGEFGPGSVIEVIDVKPDCPVHGYEWIYPFSDPP